MASFTDELLPDLMIEHQRRMLSTHSGSVAVTLLVNRPYWLTDEERQQGRPQLEVVKRLRDSGAVAVQGVNFSLITDVARLRRVLAIHPPGAEMAYFDAMYRTIDLGSNTTGDHMVSNLVGMLQFLERCVEAADSIGLCVYLDPDVFLYRHADAGGLADLAAAVFERNPSLVALQPPSVCHGPYVVVKGRVRDEDCDWAPQGHLSQRYLIFNRSRLQAALPLHVHINDTHVFEKLLFHAIGLNRSHQLSGRTGRMLCGWKAFGIHPKSRMTAGGLPIKEHVQAISFASRRAHGITQHSSLASPAPGSNISSLASVTRGLPAFIDRVEQGRFFRGAKAAATLGNNCEDMLASVSRIDDGMAW